MITFSIVTVTFNAQDVLPPTLDSVLRQDYPHLQHLIIDGASTDNTLAIAQEYKALSDENDNGHEIKITSEPDDGIYFAMNKALSKAQGDYIVFLNAGDRLPHNDTLQHVMLAAEAGDAEALPAVLFGNTDIIDAKGNYLFHRPLSPPERLTWKSFRHGMLVCHQAFYARTDIAREIPFDTTFRYSADVDWCIRIMKEGQRRGLLLRNIHAVVANYMQEGQTTRHHKASLKERFRIMTRHYGLPSTLMFHLWFAVRKIIRRRAR